MDFTIDDQYEQAYRSGYNDGRAARGKCDDLRIEQIASHYGFSAQADMLCEESAEFMVALNKLRRGKVEAYEGVKEEVADVLIMARQLRYLLGYEEIDAIMEEKLQRQLGRIDDESPDR